MRDVSISVQASKPGLAILSIPSKFWEWAEHEEGAFGLLAIQVGWYQVEVVGTAASGTGGMGQVARFRIYVSRGTQSVGR
jgi:hypothetical protein